MPTFLQMDQNTCFGGEPASGLSDVSQHLKQVLARTSKSWKFRAEITSEKLGGDSEESKNDDLEARGTKGSP